MKTAYVLAGLLAVSFATPVLAANATHPYANCNKNNDNCGPTGDSMTDQLNARQLSAPPMMAPNQPMMQGQMQSTPMPGQMTNQPGRTMMNQTGGPVMGSTPMSTQGMPGQIPTAPTGMPIQR